MCEAASWRRDPDLVHRFLEKLTILAHLDRVDVGADQLYTELVENSLLVKFDGKVEPGLPADSWEQCIGAFLLDNGGGRFECKRLDVSSVRDLGIGHDRRRVGIDEHNLEALLLQSTTCLRARIIELASLTDDNWT